ncbi:MAG: formylglycine-generating enzyme family protein [bacterium]|nr:formylglycine-generating enzyme family protein [bacterium]
MSHPLVAGIPPEWASGWGEDQFGVFAEFELGQVVQKMRWIPAGVFRMGSADEEDSIVLEARPIHRVRISSGYWLGDTPVTQALWMAVMGDNPSRAEGLDLPVENVSFSDLEEGFFSRLAEALPGFEGRLPTEAEWEYACRAASYGATYRDVAGQERELAEVAWFDENSRGQLHAVAGKVPNAWGLYDMLGNVWEWCMDPPRAYHDGDIENPCGHGGASRVVRGGSWDIPAHFVRAAIRYSSAQGFRDDGLGFRLARGQESAPGKAGGASRE